MTDSTPRADRLGELYDQACKYLSDLPDTPYEPQFIDMSLGIIDRYLSQQEADREYALRRYESGIDYVEPGVPENSVMDPAAPRRQVFCDSLSPSQGECVLPPHVYEVAHEWSKTDVRGKLG